MPPWHRDFHSVLAMTEEVAIFSGRHIAAECLGRAAYEPSYTYNLAGPGNSSVNEVYTRCIPHPECERLERGQTHFSILITPLNMADSHTQLHKITE